MNRSVIPTLVGFLSCLSATHAQCLNFIAPRISPNDLGLQAQLGFSVALSADGALLLAGANLDSAPNQNDGSAYVYSYNGSAWVFQQKLTHPAGLHGTNMGESVALAPAGDTLFVGAPLTRGSVFTYRFVTGAWTFQQELAPAVTVGVSRFGSSIAISETGDRIVIGSRADTVSAVAGVGSAYIFRFEPGSPGTWVEESRLLDPAGSATNGAVGAKVAISPTGDLAVISASNHDFGAFTNPGSALVFRRTGTSWAFEQRLTSPTAASSHFLGQSVAVSADRAAIGSNETTGGSVLVFRFGSGTWTFEQRLTASDALASDGLGQSVWISSGGERIHAGAINGDGPTANTGSVYLFAREGTSWLQKQEINPPGGASSEFFGCSVAVAPQNGRLAVGAYKVNAVNLSSGAAYTFNSTAPGVARPPVANVEIEGLQHADFSVIGAGTSPFSYRWRRAGAPLSDGPSPGGGVIVGSNTNAMIITAPGAADAGDYDCIINDACGSVLSTAATLTMVPPAAPTCAGDADGNGVVNFADITSVLANFNAICP